MDPKLKYLSNFAIVVGAIATVSAIGKVADAIKVIARGYPPPRPIVYKDDTTVDDDGIEPIEIE